MRLIPTLLLVVGLPAARAASFEQLTLFRRTIDGETRLCHRALAGTPERCVAVRAAARPLSYRDGDIKIVKLLLDEYGIVHHPDGTTELGVVIEWTGQGAGVLSIDGPRGRIFALGHVIERKGRPAVELDLFGDEAMSEQFGRMVAFGESDPMRLHVLTKAWLENALGPEIATMLDHAAPGDLARP